jgi:hypothetical protein
LPKIRIISLLVLIIAITAITLPNFAQRALAASSDSSLFFTVKAETLVKADGPGGVDTYDLIRQKLGPSTIEAPDVFRNNHQGVRHIVENTGSPYGPYFTFILHDEDGNKDEVNSDRQRNEIKGDGSSPEKVLGRQGETARYHWYFRVAPNYKASNTIMFQLHNKDEGPIVKIESMGDNLVFRHDPDNCNCGKEAVLASHPFNVLRGQWLEAEVVTTYTNSGYLLMTLRDQSGKVIMHTEKNKIDMWSSSFTRPKWGIYRGTKNFNDQDTIDFADFRIQEITLQLSPPVNQAPNVDAGPDQTITLLAVANLTGTVTDDGLPNPPAAFTTTWSMVSGPGSVIFGNAGTPVTTASFSHAGEYILRLTATDSELSASDDVTINVEVVYGDSNQDGKLTAEDVHLALDWLFGQSPTPPSGSASFVATDVNNNGVIDGDDVRLMIDRLLSQP